jgi:hypothetical protein
MGQVWRTVHVPEVQAFQVWPTIGVFFAIPGLSSDYKLLVLQIESVVQAIYNLRTSEAFSTKFIFGYSRFLPLWDGWP